MTEIKLSTDEHDISDLLRYLDGDHHMSVYDRQRVASSIRRQLKDDAYAKGQRDFAEAVQRELRGLAASVITAPEERCYQDASAMISALLGES